MLWPGFDSVERLGEQCLHSERSRDFEAGVLAGEPPCVRVDPLHEIRGEPEAHLHRLCHAAFVILAIWVIAKVRRFSIRTPPSRDASNAARYGSTVRQRGAELARTGTRSPLGPTGVSFLDTIEIVTARLSPVKHWETSHLCAALGNTLVDVDNNVIQRSTMTTTTDNDSNGLARLDPVAIPQATLEKLLHHAAFAAHLVGHLDDNVRADLVGQLGDHVDAIVHGVTEILGDPRTFAAPDPVADHRVPDDGPPMLASSTGGAP